MPTKKQLLARVNKKYKGLPPRATKYSRKNAAVIANMVNLGHGFPRKLQITHRYTELIQLIQATNVPQQYRWSCNSLYDPNSSGIGHQPYYFDQLAALYDHYVVIGSKATIRIVPTTQIVGLYTCFINDDTVTSISDPSQQSEVQTAKTHLTGLTHTGPWTTTLKWSAKKMFGGSVLSNTELQGTSSANPTEQSYFNVNVVNADYVTGATFDVYIMCEYIAIWKELKDIPQS